MEIKHDEQPEKKRNDVTGVGLNCVTQGEQHFRLIRKVSPLLGPVHIESMWKRKRFHFWK